ncbi:uncharacterized protein [Nicotiana tomentosiformis]|uniref:uncharacterized protein n=1 Tax=Nicotiana tomentosiformis TaxID=4098 RepID=UPI00388CD1BF
MPSPPATATSSPPSVDTRDEEVPPLQSPSHGDLGYNYSFPSTDLQKRRSFSLSISTGFHLLSQPVELASYLKTLSLEKDKNKIQSLSRECMINNVVHNAAALLAEREQIIARLPVLEAQVAEAVKLETRLQQSEQEAKAKWSEVQNVVLVAAEREAASTERLNNLEAALNSKAKEATAAEEKHVRMEEKYKRVMEHNKVYNSTICDLDVSLQAARSERNNLSTEVDQLKEELQRRTASLIVEKTYLIYSMRIKTLEEAKVSVIDFDAEIAKASELESTNRRGLPDQPNATDSSSSDSQFSGTEEEL